MAIFLAARVSSAFNASPQAAGVQPDHCTYAGAICIALHQVLLVGRHTFIHTSRREEKDVVFILDTRCTRAPVLRIDFSRCRDFYDLAVHDRLDQQIWTSLGVIDERIGVGRRFS